MDDAQRQILRMLQEGTLTAEEANRLLTAMGGSGRASPADTGGPAETSAEHAVEPSAPPPEQPAARPAGTASVEPVRSSPSDVAVVAAGSGEEVRRGLRVGGEPAAALRAAEPAPVTREAPPGKTVPLAGVDAVLMPEPPPDLDRYRRCWQVPFAVALGFLAVSALGMAAAQGIGGFFGAVGFLCAWSVFMLAALAVGVALWSRTARWLHVRVRERDGRRFAISLPVPLRLVGWLRAVARPFVGEEARGHLDMVAAFAEAIKMEMDRPDSAPLIIDVDDEDESVQVYFG